MITKEVVVTQTVRVTVDDTKFTPEFFAEFARLFYEYDTLDQHIQHLAQLHARGLADDGNFIEGYGPAQDMGIRLDVVPHLTDAEIID